jgi:hypothetical protein
LLGTTRVTKNDKWKEHKGPACGKNERKRGESRGLRGKVEDNHSYIFLVVRDHLQPSLTILNIYCDDGDSE